MQINQKIKLLKTILIPSQIHIMTQTLLMMMMEVRKCYYISFTKRCLLKIVIQTILFYYLNLFSSSTPLQDCGRSAEGNKNPPSTNNISISAALNKISQALTSLQTKNKPLKSLPVILQSLILLSLLNLPTFLPVTYQPHSSLPLNH